MVTWLQSLRESLLIARPALQLAPDRLPVPWVPGRTAILARISALELTPDGSLVEPSADLPDQQVQWPDQCLAAGAGDQGSTDAPTAQERAQLDQVVHAMHCAADDHTPAKLTNLYHALLTCPLANSAYVLAQLPQDGAAPAQIATLARWLAQRAPDIMPVKMAIALLGQYGGPADADLMMTLGRHEAFTFTCAIALCALLGPEQSQTAMWNLARRVHGWGRIQVVRRLAATGCPEIQQWLLRDGYKNAHMDEYLAYLCATGGKLLPALQAGLADERLLIGAGDILQALLSGRDCPAQKMADYADGAAATLAWLACVQRQRPRAPQIAASAQVLSRIESYPLPWDHVTRRRVALQAGEILAFDYWPAQVCEQGRSSMPEHVGTAPAPAPAPAPAFAVGT